MTGTDVATTLASSGTNFTGPLSRFMPNSFIQNGR